MLLGKNSCDQKNGRTVSKLKEKWDTTCRFFLQKIEQKISGNYFCRIVSSRNIFDKNQQPMSDFFRLINKHCNTACIRHCRYQLEIQLFVDAVKNSDAIAYGCRVYEKVVFIDQSFFDQ